MVVSATQYLGFVSVFVSVRVSKNTNVFSCGHIQFLNVIFNFVSLIPMGLLMKLAKD